MASFFQTASLVASPSYPNSVAWSDENLVAVASGHLVTILNPSLLIGPRGLITIPPSKPFPIGVINREDLLTSCLLSTCLSRDVRPCVRSISWSHLGLAPNSGCLLAVCTTEGRVKLYRSPYCEFSAEWIEVKDISDLLFDYLLSINFGEVDVPSTNSVQVSSLFYQCVSSILFSIEMQSGKSIATNLHQYSSVLRSRGKETPLKRTRESDTLPLLTAGQYASRSSMLSSVIVAWSPALYLSSDIHPNPRDRPSSNYGLLAVGGKSGKISFWRIDEPRCYAVENSMDSVDVILVGLLQAHNSWITAISWGLSADASKSQVLLVTGSSDGSVKVWLGDIEVMLNSSEVSSASFSLLKEVTTVAPAPVSVLSLTAPARSLDEILLAIGRGSGSLEVWICDILSCKFQCAGLYDAHGQVVTGLAWGFDGRCLYSCSQDNSIRCWVLHESALHKVPIPSNSLGLWRSTDLPHASDSCFGLAISPGNLVVAVARGFDATLLNPMYQARTQKAAVEFFWIGGQQLEVSSDINKEFDIEAFPGFSKWEMMCWESNILWSLTKYDNTNKPLVLWDVITALSALKQYTPDYVKRILVKWFSSWLPGCNIGVSIDEILLHARDSLTKIHSRRMHLLNIFCSRLILNNKQDGLEEVEIAKDEYLKLWMELLVSTESQLRERLVAFSFTTVLRLASSSATNAPTDRYWLPHGVAQMEQWVAINNEQIQDHLKLLLSEVGKLGKRLHSISEYVPEEQCRFCPASVPFESPEVASCVGSKNSNGVCERHKLSRCAASMQL
ncbi:WD40 repeat [Macleaya cordata]|uniref:WD40 repeat n=1 Tax=Macleaya cordata TaxID=56857 RepID=A0A200Q2M5_MACCD|nr:WD40 repeat [Macleaya cordata]